MIHANSITEVIAHLDNIILWCRQNQSRMGYFATLYKKMTVAVQQGILSNRFEDGKRMERLDIIFANRYLQAWEAYVNKQKCTNAWCAAFDYCNKSNLIVLQHLILGINTHINLDLGIAAAETCPGDEIHGLKTDFEKINDVIEVLTQSVQEALCNVWFPLRALAKIANHKQDAVINFSISAARQTSWANAVALATVSGPAHDNYINMIDKTVVNIAARVTNPGFALNFILKPVRFMEPSAVNEILDILER